MRYIIVGGGTGGHIYPALAIADALKSRQPDVEILYVGAGGKMERQIVQGANRPFVYSYKVVRSTGLPRPLLSLKLPLFLANFLIGLIQSFFILIYFRPRVLIGTGGYATVPLVMAAGILRIKIFLHEQNATPGLANKFLSRFATRLGVSWPETLQSFPAGKAIVVGYPVRANLRRGDKVSAKIRLGFKPETPVIFAFGGSQSARTINRALSTIIPALLNDHNVGVVLGTGRMQSSIYHAYNETINRLKEAGITPEIQGKLIVRDYIDDIQSVYDAADIVIARAGAGTVMELAAMGVPALLIPKAGLPGNHQYHNAHQAETVRGAVVILESKKSPSEPESVDTDILLKHIIELLRDEKRRTSIGQRIQVLWTPDAMERIINELDLIPDAGKYSRKPPVHWYVLGLANEMLQRAGRGSLSIDDDTQRLVQSFLASPNWRVRNIGVKLVGKCKDETFIHNILNMITDRTPISFWEKFFGGDFYQVGFIRRNCVVALREIGIISSEIKNTLQKALDDEYWEVRSEAIAALGELCPDSDFIKEISASKIINLLHDPAFEVIVEMIRTLAALAVSPSIIEFLQELYYHPNLKVKRAVYGALNVLFERGIITDRTILEKECSKIFIPGGIT